MKNKRNQGLTSFDFITMVVSFGVIVLVVAPIVRRNMQSGNIETAQRETSTLAARLLQTQDGGASLRLASSVHKKSESRSIASVDEVTGSGRDWEGETGRDQIGRA